MFFFGQEVGDGGRVGGRVLFYLVVKHGTKVGGASKEVVIT